MANIETITFNGTTYGLDAVTDTTLTVQGMAADAKAVGDALANSGSGSGLTNDIKQALLQIAQKVAYIDDDGQDYYNALYNALYQAYSVTNNLTDVANSNAATSVQGGDSYTATLTATAGYITYLVITMNGVDITNSVFTPN